LNSELNEILSIENFFHLSRELSSINFQGKELSIKWFDDYQSEQSVFLGQYALLDDNILLIATKGTPNSYDIKKSTDLLERIHVENDLTKVDVIWDTRFLEKPSIKVRKALIQGNKQLSSFWNDRYLIIAPQSKTLIRIFSYLYEDTVENLHFSSSIENVLNSVLFDRPFVSGLTSSSESYEEFHENLHKKSKEELIEIISDLNKQQEQSTNKVLEAIGQITWEGKFKKIDVDIEEDSPNFGLLNAFSLLQQDIGEIIKEYKELNQNLELKIAERIVDFIDKESNLRAILDNSDRITWLMNTRYELIDFNVAFANEIVKRYRKRPKINQSILEIINDEREQLLWMDRFESTLKGKPGIYLDQDKYDGRERVLEIKTFPIKEVGKIKGVSVFVEDITELKDSQFRLIEKNRDLQKVNTELDSFVYRVSHDLRAPLTSILGLINLMKIETNRDKIADYINLQERSVLKLDLFIKEIINLSRNSRLGITVSKIDFNELFKEVFESQNYTKSAENIERIIEIEDNLEFYTDRQRLSIILNNLISNSLKYVDSNEKNPFVKVKVYVDEPNCIIEVSDNGIGISEVFLPKIFEMFYRATQEFTGSGLGLYIVKETVDRLKGKITVKSKTRQGSTFKVVLPNLKDRYDAAPKLED